MSARHRQIKRRLTAAQKALAELEVDLVSYGRVIDDMKRRKLPMPGSLSWIEIGRQATDRDCENMRQTIYDLESKLAEEVCRA